MLLGMSTLLLVVLAPTALLQVARMMVMNLRDRRSDELVDKRTLPVIIGYQPAVRVIVAGQFVAYGLLTLLAVLGWLRWLTGAVAAGGPDDRSGLPRGCPGRRASQ
ncbi:UbiA family prenyltransferase [Melissospora conviva]|uniref:UbiA family prenyltransferase n=1 Tax=Melissospora conviva TaxID=3388432 RepID=UPI003B76DC1B